MLDAITTIGIGALTVYPFWRILTRAGIYQPIALLAFLGFPGVLIVATVLAFRRWPNVEGRAP